MAYLIDSILSKPPRPIAFITPDSTVAQCIEKMMALDIGALVVSDGDAILGIISERDIVRCAGLHRGVDSRKITAEQILYPTMSELQTHDTIEKAMQVITRTKRRHVLVRNKGQLVAILSIGDVLYHLLDDKMREIKHLENYIQS